MASVSPSTSANRSASPRVPRSEPVCQRVLGGPRIAKNGTLLVAALTPHALEETLAIQQELQARAAEADRLRRQHVERARHEADVAQHRFLRVHPDNRLVADVLEADWNAKLRALADAQAAYERHHAADHSGLDESQRRSRPRSWRWPPTCRGSGGIPAHPTATVSGWFACLSRMSPSSRPTSSPRTCAFGVHGWGDPDADAAARTERVGAAPDGPGGGPDHRPLARRAHRRRGRRLPHCAGGTPQREPHLHGTTRGQPPPRLPPPEPVRSPPRRWSADRGRGGPAARRRPGDRQGLAPPRAPARPP